MKNRIGFLCLGQAGGNIGQLFEQLGYNCLFVNTSKEDLNTLDVKYKYHIKNGEGCNHDRNKAIALVKADHTRILEEVKDKLRHQSIIYLVFSTSGGTGSGAAVILLDIMISVFPDRKFGCICILPDINEPVKANINALKCYSAISSTENICSVFTLDNMKDDKFSINRKFVELFDGLLGVSSYTNVKGNIDNAEMYEMLSARGNAIITTSRGAGSQKIIESLGEHIFADMEQDKKLMYLGLSLQEHVEVSDITKVTGNPYDVFINYNPRRTLTVLTGLSFPANRINQIADKLNAEKEVIVGNKMNSKTNKIAGNIDWLEEAESDSHKSVKATLNLDSILEKYA